MQNFYFNHDTSELVLDDGTSYSLNDPKAFEIVSNAWLRSGWDTKYVYSFSWLGRPIIQLPEDMFRIQEVIHSIQPDVIIETGVAHGGSLIFYATLCSAIGRGRIIGVDIEIRPHNRTSIETHQLSNFIKLIEGSSTSDEVFSQVKGEIMPNEKVLILLDSNHSKEHVLSELRLYSELVTSGSFIVACDGIMQTVVGAPRTAADWDWNNPISAINEFLEDDKTFEQIEPSWPFNEGNVTERVTYWPKAFLRKK